MLMYEFGIVQSIEGDKPPNKDHLSTKTAFDCIHGWSLFTSFTVQGLRIDYKKLPIDFCFVSPTTH